MWRKISSHVDGGRGTPSCSVLRIPDVSQSKSHFLPLIVLSAFDKGFTFNRGGSPDSGGERCGFEKKENVDSLFLSTDFYQNLLDTNPQST